ncbi:MAG: DUF4058 family protein [Chloroflexota bacterium]|nr:DUF4058 family protein [Chloroflexota bacterium]
MPSPFPGMDPYIEAPRIWSDFHNGLADEIRAVLNRSIRPTYFAALTPYVTYETVEVAQKKTYKILPDVGIWKTAPGSVALAVAPALATPSVASTVSLEVPLELFSVEIRTAGDDVLVTSIEILSPVNKQRRHDAHLDYLRKRRDLLRSAAHLIEIDLLRAGLRPPLQQPVPIAPYYVMLSRATNRPEVAVWPLTLAVPLPIIPVPLLEPDPDVLLDLGAVVASVYERGGYDTRIDYQDAVPPPALDDAEAIWVTNLLASVY